MDPLQQPGRLSQRQNQVPPRPLELNLHFNLRDLCVKGFRLEQGGPVFIGDSEPTVKRLY